MPRPLPKKISQIKPVIGNVALTSHYMVQFGGLAGTLRKYLGQRGIDSRYITETIGLLCSRAILPGSGFATADVVGNFMGVAEKFAHTRIFTPMTMEFYVDNSYRSLKFIEHWMEFIASGTEYSDGVSNLTPGYYYRMNYPKQYKCDQTVITKFEKDYKRYIEYRFYGLYPLSLDSTTVSYEGSNILKASATFQYDRYVSGQSSSLASFLGTTSNKDGLESGTGTGNQSQRGQQKLANGFNNNNSNSNSSSGADFLSDAAIPRFTGLSNSGEFFKSGSSILNDDIINASWSSEFKFL